MIHRDEVHGDVRYDDLAVALLDTGQMQRLGRVYQLGYGHLVYRGGTHTRLSHSMGTYLTAAGLARALERNYDPSGGARPDGTLLPKQFLPLSPSADPADPKFRDIASVQDRWVVLGHLVRWAALLHDIGHVPLGHTLEDEFDDLYKRHDSFESPRLRDLWLGTRSEIAEVLKRTDLYPEAFERLGIANGAHVHLAVLLICTWKESIDVDGERTPFRRLLAEKHDQGIAPDLIDALDQVESSLFRPYMADLVANTISADYLDYLRRDPHNLGLDVLRDGRVGSRFWVGEDHLGQARMALSLVDRRGKPRLDTCTGVVELVRQRYRFAEIVYYHKTKVAASAMLAKAFHLLEKPSEELNERDAPTIATAEQRVDGVFAAKGRKRSAELAGLIDGCMPTSLLDPEIGDEALDGLLRRKAVDQLRAAVKAEDREQAVRAMRGVALLDGLARRCLYKTVFTMNAKSFPWFKGYGEEEAHEHELTEFIASLRSNTATREQIEREMAAAAGWSECSVLLYVPDRKSQAKGIETGALSRGPVVTLGSHEAVRDDVAVLSEKYKALWRCIILVHPDKAGDLIGLSKALDAFLAGRFPGVDLRDDGVVYALKKGAWFRYLEGRHRNAASDFEILFGEDIGTTAWDVFERYDGAQPSNGRQHLLGAALAFELVLGGAEIEAAIRLVRRLGSPEELEARIDQEAELGTNRSLAGLRDDSEEIRKLRAALRRIAGELGS